MANLKSLEEISLSDTQVTILPEWIGQLTNIKLIFLDNTKIAHLPNQLLNLPFLECLNIKNTPIKELPSGLMKKLTRGIRGIFMDYSLEKQNTKTRKNTDSTRNT